MSFGPSRLFCLTAAFAVLSACTQFPDLDSALTDGARAASYPDLVPVETLKARVNTPRIQPETALGIQARVAALRARANRLRGSVIDSPTRQRLTVGVTGS